MRRALWCAAAPLDTSQPTSLEMCRPAPTSMNMPPTASSTFSKTSCSKEQRSGTDNTVSQDHQINLSYAQLRHCGRPRRCSDGWTEQNLLDFIAPGMEGQGCSRHLLSRHPWVGCSPSAQWCSGRR